MNTYIEISKLKIYAYHGVMGQERRVGNMFEIDIRIGYPFTRALTTDDIADTISYADVCEIVKNEMNISSNLLEHVAGRIKNVLQAKYPEITCGYIKIKKITPPIGMQVQGCSVVIEW